MNRFLWLALFLTLHFTGCSFPKSSEERGRDVVSSVSQCSRLYTVQYNVRKVLTHQDFSTIEGNIFFEKITIPIPGERKIAMPMDATVKAYIDFNDFTEKNISVVDDKITITLPNPKIEMTSSKIDYANEKQYLAWNRFKFTEEEKEALWQIGRAKVLSDMKNTDFIERSQLGAYNALVPLVMAAGFKRENIVIRFDQEITDGRHDDQTILRLLNDTKGNNIEIN